MPYDGAGLVQPVHPAADHASMVPAGAMPDAGPAGTTLAPVDVNPLPNLPRPADQPGSLYQPPQPGLPYGCPDRECPYFQEDPLLDCWGVQRPGWLFDVELDFLGSHVFDHVGQFYGSPFNTAAPTQPPVPDRGPTYPPYPWAVPMAQLDWEASPRFELGYRLPSGFGELDVAYRFLAATGSGTTNDPNAAPDGTATLNSHLDLQVGDFDYASNETSLETMLGPGWGMKWRVGLRTADILFNSRADEPLADAIAGSRYYERAISNHFWGIGPHAAVELSRRWRDAGLGLVCRLDAGLLFGKTTQEFTDLATAPANDIRFSFNNLQQVPVLGGFLGLDWRPALLSRL